MTEQTLILGHQQHLVATFTMAERGTGAPPPVVAILSNSGVIPRGGPHRINVHLARAFARMGIPSVRFDMSGLGDSRRADGDRPVLEQWVADTREVMDAAQRRFGCDRFLMIGFCSGAVVGHLVALEDPRMQALLLWDMYAYPTLGSRWRSLAYRLRRAGALGIVRKLGERIANRLRPAEARVSYQRDTQLSKAPEPAELEQRLNTLSDRGVELFFVFCGGEPEFFNHEGQFKAMFGRYRFFSRASFCYLRIADHLITRKPARDEFLRITEDWVHRRVLQPVAH